MEQQRINSERVSCVPDWALGTTNIRSSPVFLLHHRNRSTPPASIKSDLTQSVVHLNTSIPTERFSAIVPQPTSRNGSYSLEYWQRFHCRILHRSFAHQPCCRFISSNNCAGDICEPGIQAHQGLEPYDALSKMRSKGIWMRSESKME